MQRVFFDKSLPRSDFINYFCSAFYLRFLKMQQPEFYGFLLHSIREGDVSQDFPFQKAFSSVQLQSQANQFSKLVVSHFNQGMYDQVPIVFGPEEK